MFKFLKRLFDVLRDKGHVKLELPNGRTISFIGGPWRDRPDDIPGIKMAPEQVGRGFIEIPIADFGVPTEDELRIGILKAVVAANVHNIDTFYVGCGYGQGRTGLFLATVLRLHHMMEGEDVDPVEELRQIYNPKAVETATQWDMVNSVQLDDIVELLTEGV